MRSHASTLPHSHVLPSSPRSYQRPPTRGSITASTALAEVPGEPKNRSDPEPPITTSASLAGARKGSVVLVPDPHNAHRLAEPRQVKDIGVAKGTPGIEVEPRVEVAEHERE